MISHPPASKPLRSRPPRRGLTLVEMLLVLTILVVIAAISWPGLQRAWVDHKIKEATEMVRTNLAKTRNIAVDAVLIYEFRYEPGGNRFLIVPHEPNGFLSEQGAQTQSDPQGQVNSQERGANSQGEAVGSDQLTRIAGMVREGVRFTTVVEDTASLGIPEIEQSVPVADWQLEGLPMADELNGVTWSEPILFFPDGSAQQSRLRLEDESGQLMELSVRGLTGAVTATPIREEPEP